MKRLPMPLRECALSSTDAMVDEQKEEVLRSQLEGIHTQAYGWALACCSWEGPLAEDVLQASYVKVLDGKARFGGRSTFKTWFFEVIRRTAAEQRRRQAFRRLVPMESMSHRLRSTSTGPEESLEASEKAARLMAALNTLPRRQREILHLVFYSDLTIKEAALVSGISLGTARTHYERGKCRLRELLMEDEK